MIKSIANAVGSTQIFSIILIFALLVSLRKQRDRSFFSLDTSQEIKGFAILAVVLSHIGYFLVDDHAFLQPWSTIAGVGVDLFLILSGYGLAVSSLKKDLSIGQFYKQRLIRLFVPMWISLLIFFVLKYFVLGISYSWPYILQAFLGIFRTADLYQDINSPLWYFTFIIFFYLLFPLVFSKKSPWLSAIALYLIPWLLLKTDLYGLSGNLFMYRIHLAAFPLGVLLASIVRERERFSALWESIQSRGRAIFGGKNILGNFIYYLTVFYFLGMFYYFFNNSGVGRGINYEQTISIITAFSILILFWLKKFDCRFLYFFGVYSYEIYLLHWPIMYSYDIWYSSLPAWLATALYLFLFIGLGIGMQYIAKQITNRIL